MNKDLIRTKMVAIKRTDFGEADRIIQVITPEGVFSVIAKGVRKEKSKMAGAIEPFSVSDIVLAKGRGDLYGLRSARLDKFYGGILKNYETLSCGYDILSSLRNVSTDDKVGSELFNSIIEAFEALDKGLDVAIIRTWWLVRLAEVTSGELNLERDVFGNKLDGELYYRYDHSDCGLVVDKLGNINKNHIKILRLMRFNSPEAICKVSNIGRYMPDCYSLAQKLSQN